VSTDIKGMCKYKAGRRQAVYRKKQKCEINYLCAFNNNNKIRMYAN